jgi:ATP-dependent DNA helicase PIF1
MALAVHCPQQQSVMWELTPGQTVDEAKAAQLQSLQRAESTTLTAFFKYNQQQQSDPSHTPFLYADAPHHLVWDKKTKGWRQRKHHTQQLGRMHTCSPKDTERFNLRLLLAHIPGPTSFEALLSKPGLPTCTTFAAAALMHNLTLGTHQWHVVMNDAVLVQAPSALRHLLVMLCYHCEIADASELWSKFQHHLIEDHTHRGVSEGQAANMALTEMEGILQTMSTSSLHMYNLPMPTAMPDTPATKPAKPNHVLDQELQHDKTEMFEQATENLAKLTPSQRAVFDRLNQYHPGLYFVDGPAGSGKSFVFNTLLADARSKGMLCIACAASGIAATVLTGGGTVQAKLRVPSMHLSEESTCNIKTNTNHAKLLQQAEVIIWDEAPMSHRWALECLSRTLQDGHMMGAAALQGPFAGKVVILGGDFRQVLPVVKHGSRPQTVAASIRHSMLWADVEVLPLHTNMRVRHKLQLCASCKGVPVESLSETHCCQACRPVLSQQLWFEKWLLMVGDGLAPQDAQGLTKLPAEICLPPHSTVQVIPLHAATTCIHVMHTSTPPSFAGLNRHSVQRLSHSAQQP